MNIDRRNDKIVEDNYLRAQRLNDYIQRHSRGGGMDHC